MIVVVLVLACFSSCGHVGDSVVGDKDDDGDDDGCGRAIWWYASLMGAIVLGVFTFDFYSPWLKDTRSPISAASQSKSYLITLRFLYHMNFRLVKNKVTYMCYERE